jgi:hypothetical protein
VRIEPAVVKAFTIYDADRLDPILVVMQDFGVGQGRLVVECYGEAWSTYWGAMGDDYDLRRFITCASADYIANRLWPSRMRRTKDRYEYLTRIVEAVQAVLQQKQAEAIRCAFCADEGCKYCTTGA